MRRAIGFAVATILGTALLTVAGAPASAADPAPAGSGYKPLSPVRVLDTRGSGAVGPQQTITVDLSGKVSPTTTAVLLNVTGTSPTTPTHITVFPAGAQRPTASNLNLQAGETRPNLVSVAVGAGQKVHLYNNNGAVHLIADLAGYYAPDAADKYTVSVPQRVLDTRVAGQRPPGPVGPGKSETLDLSRYVPASATAVTFNLTGTAATAHTYVTAWPTGTARPVASNINLRPGDTSPNQVTVALGTNRKVNLYNDAGSTHLIVDLSGFYTPEFGATFNPATPKRVLDTRDGTGGTQGPVGPGSSTYLNLYDDVPESVVGVVLNVTGTQPTSGTFITAQGQTGPLQPTSHLNLASGQTAANLVTATVYGGANLSLYNDAGHVHLIADYAGYFAIPPAAPCVTNCLYAWGSNQSGQLGIGNHRWDSLTPRHVHGLSDVKAVATGFLSGFALRGDGTVWGWGYNEWGQLGGWFGGQSAVPVRIHGLDGITAIGDGIAVRTGGTVWTWARKALSSASGTPVQVPGLTGITAVASGVDTSYALSSDGTVWAWGSNSHGQLGTGAPPGEYVSTPMKGLTGVRSISSADHGVIAVKNDGTVWTWGVNYLGELGNGTVGGFSNVPVQVPGLTGVNAISANNLQRFAVLSDGTVWGWGNNQYGALGNGQECSDSCAVPTPGRVVGLTTARTVAANTGGGYAVDTDGRVWAWGSGLGPVEGGQPGHSTTPLRQTAPTAVSAVAGGSGSGFAIVP